METTTSTDQTISQDQPKVWPLSSKGGLITGLILFLFTLVFQYFLGNFAEWWLSFIPVIGFITGIIFTQKAFKEEGDGLMSYGKGIQIAVVLGAVAGLVSGILSFAYINLIDPTIPERQANAVAEFQISIMEDFGASDSDIDKVYESAEKQKEELISASGNPLKAVGYQLLGCLGYAFFLGLIITIFTRKKSPEYEF